jgi:hypothetical protein
MTIGDQGYLSVPLSKVEGVEQSPNEQYGLIAFRTVIFRKVPEQLALNPRQRAPRR